MSKEKELLKDFFHNSTVTEFRGKNQELLEENILIDYDGRSYIRIMKLFAEEEAKLNFKQAKIQNPKYAQVDLKKELNRPFHLRFYIPKNVISTISKKIDKIVIMFNGMNEPDHFHFYDMMGEYFAESGTAAVLLPTPLNLNRRIKEDVVKGRFEVSPTDRANDNNPLLFLYNYIQSYRELQLLVKKIHNPTVAEKPYDMGFYKNHFSAETKIVLFGYSLGGLRALGFFMNDFKMTKKMCDRTGVLLPDKDITYEMWKKFATEKQPYECIITVNSGPNLQQAGVKDFFYKKDANKNHKERSDEWKFMLSKIHDAVVKSKSDLKRQFKKEEFELIDIFRFLYFDHKNPLAEDATHEYVRNGKEKVRKILNHFLAISGGSDLVVATQQIQNIAPDYRDENGKKPDVDKPDEVAKVAINQLIFSKGNHFPGMSNSEWHEVLPRVERSIGDFIENCGARDYKRDLIKKEIAKLLYKSDTFRLNKGGIQKRTIKQFMNADFMKILKGLNPTQQKKFINYYYISKVFYPHFSWLIESIISKPDWKKDFLTAS